MPIIGLSGTSKITGTIKLYDETDKKSVVSWAVSTESASYSGNKSAAVKSGHQYTLSFTGTAYNASGVGERVETSTTKTN